MNSNSNLFPALMKSQYEANLSGFKLCQVNKPVSFGYQSEEEGKDQESIQSNTTPDPGHHMGK